MPWFKVDDNLGSLVETTRIPRAHRGAAMGLWVLAGSWSARELTDGHIPAHMVDELCSTAEDAQRLVECGLWVTVDDGWQFARWEGEQPLREAVLEGRRKNAERQNKWRNGQRNAVTDAVTDNVSAAPPTRPDPTRPVSSPDGEKTPVPPALDLDDLFDEAWAEWPKKDDKKDARAKFVSAASKFRGRECELVEAITAHGRAHSVHTERKFTARLSTWLSQERWENPLPEADAASRKTTAAERALELTGQLRAREAPSDQSVTAAVGGRACGADHRYAGDGYCTGCGAEKRIEDAVDLRITGVPIRDIAEQLGISDQREVAAVVSRGLKQRERRLGRAIDLRD
jgi:hypothetical protein